MAERMPGSRAGQVRNDDGPIGTDTGRDAGDGADRGVGDVAPREVGTGSWGGVPARGPLGTEEAVDRNRPVDVVTEPKPVDLSGIRYAPRPQDRGYTIAPQDTPHVDTAGQALAEDEAALEGEEPRVQQGAQP